MVKVGVSKHEPVPIGDVATPPFVRLPDPASLFAARAKRFRSLAENHDLKPYLLFLAGLCDAQHALQDGFAQPDLPVAEALARAREFAMPPLSHSNFLADPDFESILERFLSLAQHV